MRPRNRIIIEPLDRRASRACAHHLVQQCVELLEQNESLLAELPSLIRFASLRGKILYAEQIQKFVVEISETLGHLLYLFKTLENEIAIGLRGSHLGIIQLLQQTISDAENDCVEFRRWWEKYQDGGKYDSEILLADIECGGLKILVMLNAVESLSEWACTRLSN